MENSNDYKKRYAQAAERVEKIKGFYSHLTTYILVIGGLAALNYYQNDWIKPWFLWAAFGWGIGIISHAVGTFRSNLLFSKDWEDRKIQEFMDKEKNESRF